MQPSSFTNSCKASTIACDPDKISLNPVKSGTLLPQVLPAGYTLPLQVLPSEYTLLPQVLPSEYNLTDDEKAAGVAENIVAIDGIAVVTDPANTAAGLTKEQLSGIYTGEIKN